jgi:hypothetical protein
MLYFIDIHRSGGEMEHSRQVKIQVIDYRRFTNS